MMLVSQHFVVDHQTYWLINPLLLSGLLSECSECSFQPPTSMSIDGVTLVISMA